jgi:hypothetical protein
MESALTPAVLTVPKRVLSLLVCQLHTVVRIVNSVMETHPTSLATSGTVPIYVTVFAVVTMVTVTKEPVSATTVTLVPNAKSSFKLI